MVTEWSAPVHSLNAEAGYLPPRNWGSAIVAERLDAVLSTVGPGASILDLGCGRGAYVAALANKGFEVTGSDVLLYPEWIRRETLRFVQNGADALPFSDKAFDATILFEVLEHCESPHVVIHEIRRCTKDWLILSVPNCALDNRLRQNDLALAHWTDTTHRNFFTKLSLLSFLQDLGLNVIEMSDCYKVSPNTYYWRSLNLPWKLRRLGETVFDAFQLAEEYWSSILVVARI